jgi:hypothetical protein
MNKSKIAGSNLTLLLSIISSIIYFPIWWYSWGFFRFARGVFYFLKNRANSLGVFIWLKNIFVPMYGQSDFVGRLISFGIRLVQIIARGFLLIIWLIFCIFLILAWLALPVLIIWATSFQFK